MNPPPSVHDLLGPLHPGAVQAEIPAEQESVDRWLREAPFAVVRRAPPRKGLLPLGVRGIAREQRCAAWVAGTEVFAVARPEDLRFDVGAASFPAYQALDALQRRWHRLEWAWGPVGSAGFSLASKCERVHERSDLDLLLRIPAKPSTQRLQWLIESLKGLGCHADVQVETPFGLVALREFEGRTGPVLLRTRDGIRLTPDPWRDPLSCAGTPREERTVPA